MLSTLKAVPFQLDLHARPHPPDDRQKRVSQKIHRRGERIMRPAL